MFCRTKSLGGHISRCTACDHTEQSYNSCWNRHCPKCQGGLAFQWVQKRREELLPVPYFHLVFTLPSELRSLCYRNKRVMYNLLLRASAEAIADAVGSRFHARAGHIGIIHSWNQQLQYHPHVHHVLPAVGLTDDGKAVLLGNDRFLVPVRVLSKLFRGKFISGLKRAYRAQKLFLGNDCSHLQNERDFEHLLSRSTHNDWVVYAKRPFAGPETVLKYLAAYTHRVGIANSRLRYATATHVTFAARDREHKNKKRLVTISNQEFTRRFLLHGLPKAFQRIRYFGFLLNQKRKAALTTIRQDLSAGIPAQSPEAPLALCPHCHLGTIKRWLMVKPHRLPQSAVSRSDQLPNST